VPNANTRAAGSLARGVLTVTLEARRTVWFPDGDSLPGREIIAFAEGSGPPLVPGPLVRVPAGTTVELTVHNTLDRDTLVFGLPSDLRGTGSGEDSITVAPGQRAAVRFIAAVPGNYLYRARTNDPLARALKVGGLMAGALVVDSASAVPRRDRVMVLLALTDSVINGTPAGDSVIFSINGRSWPHTERLSATVGDTLHWRVINGNNDIHPMHLHGFYYRVDALTGPASTMQGAAMPTSEVVTTRLPQFSAMSMTWVASRAGNWLFHCHFQLHVARTPRLDASGSAMHENHAMTGMTGLVLGIVVNPRPGERVSAPAASPPPRRLRLVAVQDSAFPDSAPSMRFLLEEPAVSRTPVSAGPGFSPPIVLERGKPVSITVVNHLREPTAVHWHGIELESYYDGVAGFGGVGGRISPIIAPGDSFEARFAPPRSGTFIYHPHANEPVQHRAGLVGPLLVVDSALGSQRDDYTIFLKTARAGNQAVPVLDVNGKPNPDTIVFHVGRPARLRLMSLALLNPNAAVQLTARQDSQTVLRTDSLLVQWQPIAKDGADIPLSARRAARARQIVAMGETYDFEFTPTERGTLRVEVRGAFGGRLLGRVPVRVE
jgi:FtsP/CotA-like multicopper oxidase with cupredoxin domain